MILGIDHIAVSTPSVHDSARSLKDVGFEVAFIEDDISNGEPKRDYLSRYTPLHSIALCRASQGIAVEFTQHATSSERQGSYHLFSPGSLPIPSQTNRESFSDEWLEIEQLARSGQIHPSGPLAQSAEKSSEEDSVTSGIRAVGLWVNQLEESVQFWRNSFRFREMSNGISRNGIRWARLSFRSIRPNWSVELILAERRSPIASMPMLDDEGATCLAFLSTDIGADLSRINHERTNIFELDVAGKRLSIALLRGPSGEIIELIQPPAETKSARSAVVPASITTHSFA